MKTYKELQQKIENKKAKICIIGLGYVGLPLTLEFAKKGYFLYGYDTSRDRVNNLYKKKKYITDIDPKEIFKFIEKNKFKPTSEEAVIADSDAIIICVPTPLRKVKTPDISYIIKASRAIKKYLKKGQLIILESTTYPGTSREVILPILEKTGLKEGKDFYLSFSPERVDPGNKEYPISKIPKVVGGLNKEATALTKALYSKIIKKVVAVSSVEAAETVKLLENTFRMVNIGLVNEFALVCDKLGVNIWEVIEAAKTKPFGFMPFYPGPGVGGHCLPCDPLYLSWKAKRLGFKTKMIDLASLTNHFMPRYIAQKAEDILKNKGISLKKAKILVLGVTYKKDVKDLRESPALDIIEYLQKKGAKTDFYDPLVPYLSINSINLKRILFNKTRLKKYDCIVVITDHSGINYKSIRENAKLIFDTRNIYKKDYKNVIRL